MAEYKILTNMIADHQEGDVVSESEFADANISALVEAGHIALVAKSTKSADLKKDE